MTDTKARPNIFNFATSELSHSAYWAWILDCLNYPDEEFAAPREVAIGLLKQIGASDFAPPFVVDREVTLDAKSRVDICLTEKREVDGEPTVGKKLLIENKVSDNAPWHEQVERYRQFLGEGDHIAVVSTAFDLDVRDHNAGDALCGYAGLEEIYRNEKDVADRHVLVGDHYEWVRDKLHEWIAIDRKARSSVREEYEEALATPEGQWMLMDYLTEGIAGHRRSGINRGGTPRTRCRFADGDGKTHDAISYRIDRRKDGYYFAVCQYQKEPTKGKGDRLNQLRDWWSVAAKDSYLEWSSRTGHGKKTSTIALLFFEDNPPESVAEELPKIHQKFSSMLRSAGWDVWE
jgi:hypothetical protein